MVILGMFPRNLGPLGYIIILELAIIAFFGLLFIGTQLQSIDIKQIALQNQQTTNDTNKILTSGNRTSTIINEVRNIADEISKNFTQAELSRQNQTKFFLPALENSFENVKLIVNISSDLKQLLPQITNSVNNVTNATSFLANNFGPDTGYIERENFQYQQSNRTSQFINETIPKLLENQEKIKSLLRELNSTL
jgi:hypothetical protein